jgi:hypothetical protein
MCSTVKDFLRTADGKEKTKGNRPILRVWRTDAWIEAGGKIGKMRGARDFVKGVSELGKGNELLALQCLKKAATDENMHMPWSDIQDPLVKFLEMINELPENVRSVGREVADLYGRYNPEKFRGVWEKLNVIKGNKG